MTNKEFKKYKNIADKAITLLNNENMSSAHDIKIIYNIIMNFPYCIDTEGHYIYGGKFYNSLKDLPINALKQIVNSK